MDRKKHAVMLRVEGGIKDSIFVMLYHILFLFFFFFFFSDLHCFVFYSSWLNEAESLVFVEVVGGGHRLGISTQTFFIRQQCQNLLGVCIC